MAKRISTLAASMAVVAGILLPGSVTAMGAPTGSAATTAAAPSPCGGGDPGVVAGSCTITIVGHDFGTGALLPAFNYIVNVDNSKLPNDPLALSTESNSPIVREGNQDRTTITLPDGRYLISMRAPGHKMWGAYLRLPADANVSGQDNVTINLTATDADHPLPLGRINVYVFEDNAWTNGAPDAEEAATGTGGLGGFQVGLEEQTGGAVTVDYNNDPLCGGVCRTEPDGFVQIDNLGPATYFIDVHAPDHCNPNPSAPNRLTQGPGHWYQTTTIDGGLQLMASVEEGADGTGAPGEQLWEPPNRRTAYWFGFVCADMDWPSTGPYSGGTGEITGQARNWVEWAPYTTGTYNTPVENPLIALTDSSNDQTVFVGRGDGAGNFDIQNVPAGTYNMSVWDEQLSYIMRFKPITVAAGQTVDANDIGDDGEPGLGVSRWFGWLEGTVYKDVNGNGQFDDGIDAPLANTDMDQRWRDGSIKESTFTDPEGHYSYPTAEGGALGRWIVNEQGFARFSSFPGASYHDEHTDAVTPSCSVDGKPVANPCIPNAEGGGLLVNQLILEGHRSVVDWGKRDYAPGTPGQIVGITYFATTRNEFNARFQAHEDYEAAIPDVVVLLETPGPDGLPNTSDDVVVNKYVTDHWAQPNASEDPQDPPGNTFTQDCTPIKDMNGADVTAQFAPKIAPNCLEVPLTGTQTKEGKFDGGYAFASYCPGGYDLAADDGSCAGGADQVDLVAGDYIVHVISPTDPTDARACNPTNDGSGAKKVTGPFAGETDAQAGCLYRIVREEDVNVDLGNQFAPQIPPPPCVGDDHVIDQTTLVTRSNYYGDPTAHAPLCDKHLVQLQNGQNANADFFLMTNFDTDPNGDDPNDTRAGDVAEPGRLVGQVFNDIYFETNPLSPWYGEPRPIGGIPVGIYARVDTVCPAETPNCATPNVNLPFSKDRWRLLTTVTTSPDGSFEAIVPSTETYNCPIPQGPCPGMYLVTVDDPGTKANPNGTFDPNLLVATTPAEAWPGLTTQLDLPLDPISGTGCDLSIAPAGTASTIPELLQVNTPVITGSAGASSRRITITGDFIGPAGPTGANGGRIQLTDQRTGAITTLLRASSAPTGSNGGIVSWTPGSGSTADRIVVQLPAISSSFPPGQKQLTIVASGANGARSINGITIHVLGSNNGVVYNPQVRTVPAPPPAGTNAHALQDIIDVANRGDLLVLSPGVYNENILMWKPVMIQGIGPGGIIGSHELQSRAPEDPRFRVVGSVIDGRFFQQNATAYDALVAAHGSYAVDPTFSTILRGADITAVAKTTSAYNLFTSSRFSHSAFTNARVDAVGLQTGRGDGAGGIQTQAYINNLRITNDILENNGGIFAGGIGLGQPYAHSNHNYNVRIANDRILGNGGLTRSGGIGIFYGSNNYEVASSVLCSNFGVEYGAGISHWGLSPGGSIHDNTIVYNDAVDSGAGIAIQSEVPVNADCTTPTATLAKCRGTGSGAVDIDRNVIAANYSGDDGGAMFLSDSFTQRINVRNNIIANNGAADLGAIMLDDAANVAIVNNTVANNVSTASSENSAINVPHGAGLTAEANEPLFQASLPASAPDFSNPVALFDNIFWSNDAYVLDSFGPGATLTDTGTIDFEIHGTTDPADTFTPRYSDLTNGQILNSAGVLVPLPANQGNTSGDPGFVDPFINELAVGGSRGDAQAVAVTITNADPPLGIAGDYHLTRPGSGAAFAASPVIDRGVRCALTPFPAPANALASCSGSNRGVEAPTVDIDGQPRPRQNTTRTRTPWDVGADEMGPPGSVIPL